MSTSSAPTLFPDLDTNSPHARTYVNARLWFDDRAGYRVVFCRHEVLYRIALHDVHHLALVAVMLRQSELATQSEIAAAFGHSVATQRRWETRYRQHGADGLLPRTPTGRPATLDRGPVAFVAQWFAQAASNREMARRLGVGEATIRRVLRQAGLRRPSPPPAPRLPLDEVAPLPAVPQAADAELSAAPAAADAAVPLVPPTDLLPAPAAALASVPQAAATHLPPVAGDAPEPASDAPEPGCPAPVPGEPSRESGTSANVTATAATPAPAAAPVTACTLPATNVPAAAFTIDRDPGNRCGERFLARQGLLDDAAPLFGEHAELPRAGVLLAVPVLQAHGGLEVFQRVFGSLGPAFYVSVR
jgi:transposase